MKWENERIIEFTIEDAKSLTQKLFEDLYDRNNKIWLLNEKKFADDYLSGIFIKKLSFNYNLFIVNFGRENGKAQFVKVMKDIYKILCDSLKECREQNCDYYNKIQLMFLIWILCVDSTNVKIEDKIRRLILSIYKIKNKLNDREKVNFEFIYNYIFQIPIIFLIKDNLKEIFNSINFPSELLLRLDIQSEINEEKSKRKRKFCQLAIKENKDISLRELNVKWKGNKTQERTSIKKLSQLAKNDRDFNKRSSISIGINGKLGLTQPISFIAAEDERVKYKMGLIEKFFEKYAKLAEESKKNRSKSEIKERNNKSELVKSSRSNNERGREDEKKNDMGNKYYLLNKKKGIRKRNKSAQGEILAYKTKRKPEEIEEMEKEKEKAKKEVITQSKIRKNYSFILQNNYKKKK